MGESGIIHYPSKEDNWIIRDETETVARGKDEGSRTAGKEKRSVKERLESYKEEAKSRRGEQQKMVSNVLRKRGRSR